VMSIATSPLRPASGCAIAPPAGRQAIAGPEAGEPSTG
jgi:hypothetical protein